MRKAILVSSAVLIAAALVFAGGDPWKSKPYQQWDDKDVQRILQDSPWAKVVQVDANWKNSKLNSNDDSAQPTVPTGTPAAGGKMGAMGGQSPAPSTPAVGNVESGGPSAQASFVVRWVSSRTVQRAAARRSELAGQLKPEDAEKQLAQSPDDYEIVIGGPDMRPFQSADEDTLKTNAYLIEKKTKQKISPAKVEVSRSTDGKNVQVVAFIFPKKSTNGEPTIADDEKSVDFNCLVGGARIRTSFDIPKMQDTQGRDL
ncbi:MAG: hypothetical protein WCD43_13995 [Candidatus Acidiferrales bacterium]